MIWYSLTHLKPQIGHRLKKVRGSVVNHFRSNMSFRLVILMFYSDAFHLKLTISSWRLERAGFNTNNGTVILNVL